MRVAIGVDLGGTQIKAGAFDESGKRLARVVAPTDDGRHQGMPPFADRVRELVASLEKNVGQRADCLGISAPGLAAADGRSITAMPGRMQGLEGLDWPKWMERPVAVLNDAHAALLGEVWHGAAKGLSDAILITLGTGVGGAIWSGGRLLRGAIGRAGHFGHMTLDPAGAPTIAGMPGGLENWIGNHNVRERSGSRFHTTHELVAAYQANDPVAAEIWLRSIRALGCAVASLINILDPEAVLVGGGITKAGEALFDPLAKILDECEWRPGGHRVKIMPALLGEWAGTSGAAWVAFQQFS